MEAHDKFTLPPEVQAELADASRTDRTRLPRQPATSVY